MIVNPQALFQLLRKSVSILWALPVLYGTTAFSQSSQQISRQLNWNGTVKGPGGAGIHSGAPVIPAFEGAQPDAGRGYLPVYYELVELPANAGELSVIAEKFRYEPLPGWKPGPGQTIKEGEAEWKVSLVYERKKPFASVLVVPIRKNPAGGYEKLVSFDIRIQAAPSAAGKFKMQSTATQSVLREGKWYKIGVANDGVYKMDGSFLASMGIDISSLNPKKISLYGNGGGMLPFSNAQKRPDDLAENAIFVSGEGDGVFDNSDYILFYGQGPHRWKFNTADSTFRHSLNLYSDTTYYFLRIDNPSDGKRVALQSPVSSAATHTVTTFSDYLYHEQDNLNFLKSGREWYGEAFDILTTRQFTFSFRNILASSPVRIRTSVAARSNSGNSSFEFLVNGQQVTSHVIPPVPSNCYWCDFAMGSEQRSSFSASSEQIAVTAVYNKSLSASETAGWLNFIELNARRQLYASGDQTIFRDAVSAGPGNVSEFVIGGASASHRVWEITDPVNVREQLFVLNSGVLTYRLPTDTLREFIVFSGQGFMTPRAVGPVANQNLHAIGKTDMIIVVHPLFLQDAHTLADMHRTHDGLTVNVVTTEQVYNEFSSGARDVSAIRNFMKMLYDRAATSSEIPRYLLLYGDGSYDNKDRLSGNSNFIPTYQSENSLSPTASYVSDDYYVLLDDNEGTWNPNDGDLPDVGIGRFPVRSVAESKAVLNKILVYKNLLPASTGTSSSDCGISGEANSFGDWRNLICFVADDEDGNTHLSQADYLATYIDTAYPQYNLDKIYIDAYRQEATPGGSRYPEAEVQLNRRVEKGSLILNYTGHGGEGGWTHERVLGVEDIVSWKNLSRLSVFMTATCEFSRFDDPDRTSAGELVLLNPYGGAVALLSTVRLVYSSPNFELNKKFYYRVFEPIDGKMPALGDVFRLTKRDAGPIVNNRNFTLLGDPALTLAYPQMKVQTLSINGDTSLVPADTIRALGKVTVTGMVTDEAGNKLSSFNGVLYPSVFDKPSVAYTLANDAQSYVAPFLIQKNILFKGKVSVKNGEFSFSFIVPKDIAYQFGNGKISYYAYSGNTDASGAFENIIIGGASVNAGNDITGPEIKLYMNDEKFVFGGTTSENPVLYAVVRDSSGINMAGNGIGHDITAQLDDDKDKLNVLNDYFETDLDSSSSGKVRYPFSNLAEGRHQVRFKIWDVYNNSSEAYTEFVVAHSAEMALSHVLNYPNPFTTRTSFYFEHNQACAELDVLIQVFTVSGKLVKSINTTVHTEGTRSEPIEWDGTDDFGKKIGRGVYVYRLSVRSETGKSADTYEKLVILK